MLNLKHRLFSGEWWKKLIPQSSWMVWTLAFDKLSWAAPPALNQCSHHPDAGLLLSLFSASAARGTINNPSSHHRWERRSILSQISSAQNSQIEKCKCKCIKSINEVYLGNICLFPSPLKLGIWWLISGEKNGLHGEFAHSFSNKTWAWPLQQSQTNWVNKSSAGLYDNKA